MKLVIEGPPRTKKTGQRIFRNKKTGAPFITSKASASAWEKDAIRQLKLQALCMGKEGPIERPVHVMALFYRDARRGDLTNYQQALGDALQSAGIIANDSLIESWDLSRKLIDREWPRVEIWIRDMEDE